MQARPEPGSGGHCAENHISVLLPQAQPTEELGPEKSSDTVVSPVDNSSGQISARSPSYSPSVLS